MNTGGEVAPSGQLGLTVLRGGQTYVVDPDKGWPKVRATDNTTLRGYLADALPRTGLADVVNEYRTRNLPNVWRGFRRVAAARALKVPTFYGALYATVYRGNGSVEELGLISLRVVTDAGVAYLTADMAGGASDINLFKFHGYGTGTGAEAAGDTALGTELTTEYVVNSTRPTGSQASSTNTYTTVGTLSPDSGGTLAITEHGIFSATSSGTLWDRSKFSAVNLVASADSLQTTYVATFPSGS